MPRLAVQAFALNIVMLTAVECNFDSSRDSVVRTRLVQPLLSL